MSDDLVTCEPVQDDVLLTRVRELQIDVETEKRTVCYLSHKQAVLGTALNNILWHCRNAGKGNAIVNDRIIDRIEEMAMEALDRKDGDLWRPIETAPMDGTPILGYSTEGVSYVCWHRKGAWVFFKNHRGDEWHFEPTCWTRLPTPGVWPTVTGKEQVDGSNPV